MTMLKSLSLVFLVLVFCGAGCSKTSRDLKLDAELARSSLEKALKAWVEGKKPADLKPEITVGDAMWNAGKKLVSFEIKTADEKSDGSNLYIPVLREMKDDKGKVTKAEMIYVVGTSPVVTIFPQET